MTAAVPPEIDGSGAATAADATHVVEFTLGEKTCAIDVDAVDRDHLERLATDAIEARIVNGVFRRETEAGVRLVLWLDVDRLIAAITGNQP